MLMQNKSGKVASALALSLFTVLAAAAPSTDNSKQTAGVELQQLDQEAVPGDVQRLPDNCW